MFVVRIFGKVLPSQEYLAIFFANIKLVFIFRFLGLWCHVISETVTREDSFPSTFI
jgi:hypothetical protein